MTHYQEIRLIPSPELNINVIMNCLYEVLHKALVSMDASDIGFSFPDIRSTGLGGRIRLHAGPERLQSLDNHIAISEVRDHLKIGEILKTPETAESITVRRVQCKSNAERLRRRYVKRHGVSAIESKSIIPNEAEHKLNLPFAILRSRSTGQVFRLFIEQKKVIGPVTGSFNSYGLSDHTTVPMF